LGDGRVAAVMESRASYWWATCVRLGDRVGGWGRWALAVVMVSSILGLAHPLGQWFGDRVVEERIEYEVR
jgi:hypothetical protein